MTLTVKATEIHGRFLEFPGNKGVFGKIAVHSLSAGSKSKAA
jgi:hypothetical protein